MLYAGKLEKTSQGKTITENYFQCTSPECSVIVKQTRCGKSRKQEEVPELPQGLDSRLYW